MVRERSIHAEVGDPGASSPDGGRVGHDARDEGGELVLADLAAHHVELRGGRGHLLVLGHSGMFPCFLGGSAARLVRSARSARVTCARVSLGSITAST